MKLVFNHKTGMMEKVPQSPSSGKWSPVVPTKNGFIWHVPRGTMNLLLVEYNYSLVNPTARCFGMKIGYDTSYFKGLFYYGEVPQGEYPPMPTEQEFFNNVESVQEKPSE